VTYRRDPEVITRPDVLRFTLRLLALILASVVIGGIVGSWSSNLGVPLFLLALTLPLLLLVFGLGMGVRVASPRTANEPLKLRLLWFAMPLALSVVAVAALLPALWLGLFLGNETLLLVYHRQYRAIIREVQIKPMRRDTSAWLKRGSVTYVVDASGRIAFEPGGFLDNWSGIVWDPTGQVELARGFDPHTGRFYAPDRITKLFGGDLVSCRKLWPDWYDCSFT